MKKSKLHYSFDIATFGVLAPAAAFFALQKAIEYDWIVLTDTVLGDFLKEFTLEKTQNAIIIVAFCTVFFGSIIYCLSIGKDRELISKHHFKIFSEMLMTVGIATTLVILATIALSELQLSIFTAWISFVALTVSFSKLSLNGNIDRIENDRDNKQSGQDSIDK